MDSLDMNWWGLFVVPVGLIICFGPVLLAWALAEARGSSTTPPDKQKR